MHRMERLGLTEDRQWGQSQRHWVNYSHVVGVETYEWEGYRCMGAAVSNFLQIQS